MRVRQALFAVVLCGFLAPILSAQDAVKADPKHYTFVSENAQVRILKAHYGPHEKGVMHSHPATVAVFLTDANGTFTFPDGKTEAFTHKAGDVQYGAAGSHLPENTSDSALDVVVIELKPHAAHYQPAAKPAPKPATAQ